MLIEIKNRFNDKIILSGEYEKLKDCLEKNYRANLSGADLSGADLSGANLTRANLYGANLSRADLSGADLSGANGIILPVISISGTKHNFYYHAGIIKVGCESHTVAEWMICYAKIGEMAGYTESEIEEYYRYIKFCADLKPEAK